MSERYPAIGELLSRSDDYPRQDGTVGFGLSRDGLIALLQECTPRMDSISVVPHHVGNGDMTSFTITTYVSFSRSEMSRP
ncbi:hypothetical protein FGL91_00030 [Microbacterium sp. CBA3102]|uniref:hypothetical protein n=1 Tax=Microbacterium sp. CBA3102 TaxID=2603598 RepID=UPI0011BB2407|nr:hypothetical protein [Microbacterium sp. CBA3102]QEA27076.1 hypothetical protein FGL91_00030 [Microbacterium sp. CBA3102]